MVSHAFDTSQYGVGFCVRILFPGCNRSRIQTNQLITMRSGRNSGKKRKPSAASKLSSESKARIDEKAQAIGIRKPAPGDQMDRKYNAPGKAAGPQPTFYQMLAGVFGVETLEKFEKILYVVLSAGLGFFLVGGLAISSEAFFKASGSDIPEGLDPLITNLQQLFTPSLFIFLALSSFLGLYKQSQLSSGVTSYTELEDKEKSNK